MPGRVLIIDDVATDRIGLKVKFSAACYDVLQASSAEEGLRMAREEGPCLVMVSAEIDGDDAGAGAVAARGAASTLAGPSWVSVPTAPGGTAGPRVGAAALCRRLRGHPATAAVPVIVTTRRDDPASRLAMLEAGADEVLRKPVDDRFLLARMRSLLRARDEMAELRLRESTSRVLGFAEAASELAPPGSVVLVAPEASSGGRLRRALGPHLSDRLSVMAPDAILSGGHEETAPDVFMVDASCAATAQRTLSILPELRARPESRHAAIIVLTAPGADDPAVLALDLGANDVATATGDPAELALRVRKQIRWKQGRDRLRQTVRDGLHAAITDPLTGLYNRRYAMPHLARICEVSRETGRRFGVLLVDLDHFKAVNDVHGHAAGDAVLVEVAERLRGNLRGMDLVARIGGEEFLVAMPDTGLDEARIVAERLCGLMRVQPIALPDGGAITVTMSIGLAMGGAQPGATAPELGCEAGCDTEVRRVMDAADRALYGAKSDGRAQVTVDRSAA